MYQSTKYNYYNAICLLFVCTKQVVISCSSRKLNHPITHVSMLHMVLDKTFSSNYSKCFTM